MGQPENADCIQSSWTSVCDVYREIGEILDDIGTRDGLLRIERRGQKAFAAELAGRALLLESYARDLAERFES